MSIHRKRLEHKFPDRAQLIFELLHFCSRKEEGCCFSEAEVGRLCEILINKPGFQVEEFWNGFSSSLQHDSREATDKFIRDFVGWEQVREDRTWLAHLKNIFSFWRRIL